MPLCTACRRDLPQIEFSKAQLKKKGPKRCSSCAAGRSKHAPPPTLEAPSAFHMPGILPAGTRERYTPNPAPRPGGGQVRLPRGTKPRIPPNWLQLSEVDLEAALRKLNPRLPDADVHDALGTAAFLRRQQAATSWDGKEPQGAAMGQPQGTDAVDPRHAAMGMRLRAVAPDITNHELLFCLEEASFMRQREQISEEQVLQAVTILLAKKRDASGYRGMSVSEMAEAGVTRHGLRLTPNGIQKLESAPFDEAAELTREPAVAAHDAEGFTVNPAAASAKAATSVAPTLGEELAAAAGDYAAAGYSCTTAPAARATEQPVAPPPQDDLPAAAPPPETQEEADKRAENFVRVVRRPFCPSSVSSRDEHPELAVSAPAPPPLRRFQPATAASDDFHLGDVD